MRAIVFALLLAVPAFAQVQGSFAEPTPAHPAAAWSWPRCC